MEKINLIFFLLFQWVCLAQTYPSIHYSAEGELPNNTVRALFLDSQDILWIATNNGVAKKQNNNFSYFFTEDGLAMNSTWAIAQDNQDNMWFGSYGGGISRFDGKNFTTYSKKDGLIHDEITKMLHINGFLYVGTSDGISIIDIKTMAIHSKTLENSDQLFRISEFFVYKDQVYAVSYRSGTYKIELNNDHMSMTLVNDQQFLYGAHIENDSIFLSNKGFFQKHHLLDFLSPANHPDPRALGTSVIWGYQKTKKNRLFAAAWGMYENTGGVYEIVNDSMVSMTAKMGIESQKITTFAYDPDLEKLYVGTLNNGFYEIELNESVLFHPKENETVLGFAHTDQSRAILYNDKLEIDTKTITPQELKKWSQQYVATHSNKLPKYEDFFYELKYDTKATDIKLYSIKNHLTDYWINTSIGIYRFDKQGVFLAYLPLHTLEFNFSPDNQLIETHPYHSLRIYSNLAPLEYTYYSEEDVHTPTSVVGSYRNEHKTYLLSVFHGLFSYEKRFRSYYKDGLWNEKNLRHITAVGNNLAISNEEGDVYIVEDGKEDFKVIEKIPRAKIHGNNITFLKSYGNNILIGTEKGLNIINHGSLIFLDHEQGLKPPLLSAEVINNKLYVGSKNGFYSVLLDRFTHMNSSITNVYPTTLKVRDSSYKLTANKTLEKFLFDHDQNSIRITFKTNKHPYPNKLRYQYRLHPSEAWSSPSTEPELFFPYLEPNTYNIAVKITDASTGFHTEKALLGFEISPPYYKKWWFTCLLALFFIGVIIAYFKNEIRKNNRFEHQKSLFQKRVEETKMEALLAQMNPHFIFNTLNSIQHYIASNDKEKAIRYLGKFSQLIRTNLDNSSLPFISLEDELEYLTNYIEIENIRYQKRVKVSITVDDSVDLYATKIPTMILQPFVENVFVHAFPERIKNPTLTLSFQYTDTKLLKCRVKDNGIGKQSKRATPLHTSKGLALVKERLKLLGYDVDATLNLIYTNSGTEVTVILDPER
ncbi:histidine kinase [Arenibacter sp. 6A1]|uniref:sensor histidine kinase n=1 Tax=Arenibacter sp. 6A1 TaxID=2720391 RepID=UPI001446625D|nr:histidine kinase [Arenibacter sp. 6A1]NKI27998.1 histidine kinase [Arenibacter sp. 6A1]